MYENFYGFTEKPFNATPDPKFFFPSNKHTEALNSLIYAINERKGFVVITGEIGAGKTTVSRALLNKLDINTRVAFITNTHLTAKELIVQILEELEVEYKRGGKQKLLSQLNEYLIRQLAQDVNVVLIVDEAQNLTPNVLEEIRMLSNLETEKEKLIQIILMGQPQLKKKLEDIRLEQFRQRIAVYYHINSLDREETQEYVLHRLRSVSSNGVGLFTPDAIELLYSHSRGIPRIINLLCDSALLTGYIFDTKSITREIISEVIKERDFNNTSQMNNQYSSPNTQYDNIKLHCCSDCSKYNTCQTKWLRGTKGEEQACCPSCQDYKHCMESVKKVKLN